jgi:hypothetical protein
MQPSAIGGQSHLRNPAARHFRENKFLRGCLSTPTTIETSGREAAAIAFGLAFSISQDQHANSSFANHLTGIFILPQSDEFRVATMSSAT